MNAQALATKLKQQHELTLMTLANGHAPYSTAKAVHGRLRNLALLDDVGSVTELGHLVAAELRARLAVTLTETRAAARTAAATQRATRDAQFQYAASSTWK